jgi:chemotaxis protein MotA
LEITTIIGIGFGFACVIISIIWNGANIADYIDMASVFVVIGGVIGSTIASFPMSTLKNLIKIISKAFKKSDINLTEDIEMLIRIANVARREGILALEETVSDMDDPFLKKGIMLIVDGSEPTLVHDVMETEISFIQDRHSSAQGVLLQMSAYSPAFGMIGTLIGLINMLRDLADMSALGPNMAVALVTTFYGVILANIIFTPMAKKLKSMSADEILQKELLLEGMLSIQDGENPRIIREKLSAFLSRSQLRIAQDALEKSNQSQGSEE